MLKLEHIKKSFHQDSTNEIRLYENLNLEIKDGEFVSIIGSNGSGKSTLFNLISGNIEADFGDISLDGKPINRIAKHKRSKQIARVYQDPSKGVAPSLTILENMSMAANKGNSFGLTKAIQKNQEDTFKSILKPLSLSLEDKMDVSVQTLSGGQRQSLSLLMATMNSTKLLLLDEHTAALDPKTSEVVIKLTDDIVREKKITTLMITHNLKHALEYGDRLIMLHQGNIVMDVSKEEKQNMNVKQLIKKFHELNLSNELSDEMMLTYE